MRSGPYVASRVAVCVPTFDLRNGRARALLASVQAYTDADWEPYVVDGHGRLCGPDHQVAYVRRQNEAMALGVEGGADYLLAVNDDVLVSPGWLPPLLDALRDGAWCATPDMTHADGLQVFAPYAMLWRSGAWEEIGGLDERFVHWASDVDIARRLFEAGHPPVKVFLSPPIRHELGATGNEQPSLGPVCMADLLRYEQKWGCSAEEDKFRMARAAT
jgi:hypothetical protein